MKNFFKISIDNNFNTVLIFVSQNGFNGDFAFIWTLIHMFLQEYIVCFTIRRFLFTRE